MLSESQRGNGFQRWAVRGVVRSTRPARLLAWALVLALVFGGAGFAAPAPAPVMSTVRSVTGTELIVMAGGQAVKKAISWGRVVKYSGVVTLVGAGLYAALNWFYDQAKQSTGTPLDEWYYGVPAGTPMPTAPSPWPQYGAQAPAGNRQELETWSRSMGERLPICQVSGCRPWIQVYSHGTQGRAGIWAGSGFPTYLAVPIPDGFPSAAQAQAILEERWLKLLEELKREESLEEHLRNNPSSLSAMQNQVWPGYLSHQEGQAAWPYTYPQPYGSAAGITLEPGPNRNQWYDNPTANPNLDTDGDGWTDWEEWRAGTDLNNPADKPTVSPDPSKDSDGDGWTDREEIERGTDPDDPNDFPDGEPGPAPDPLPDSDGDGIPDIHDPCPYQASNACVDGGKAEEGEPYPDDYAREGTLQSVREDTTAIRGSSERTADAVEAIRANLAEPWIEPEIGEWEFGVIDLDPILNWAPDLAAAEAALRSHLADWQAQLDDAMTLGRDRFPFGFAALLDDVPSGVGLGRECVTGNIPIGAFGVAPVSLCDTPVDEFLAGPMRAALLAVMTVMLLWASVRTALTA